MLCSGSSCVKTEAQYPGVSVYKTRGDYFDKITAGIKNNKIFRFPAGPRPQDTLIKRRIKLVNDYVLDGEADLEHDAFLISTTKELMEWEKKYNRLGMPADTVWKYMLDQDPYIEFYRAKDRDMFNFEGVLDTTGLNQIILDGQLEKYFNKLK